MDALVRVARVVLVFDHQALELGVCEAAHAADEFRALAAEHGSDNELELSRHSAHGAVGIARGVSWC